MECKAWRNRRRRSAPSLLDSHSSVSIFSLMSSACASGCRPSCWDSCSSTSRQKTSALCLSRAIVRFQFSTCQITWINYLEALLTWAGSSRRFSPCCLLHRQSPQSCTSRKSSSSADTMESARRNTRSRSHLQYIDIRYGTQCLDSRICAAARYFWPMLAEFALGSVRVIWQSKRNLMMIQIRTCRYAVFTSWLRRFLAWEIWLDFLSLVESLSIEEEGSRGKTQQTLLYKSKQDFYINLNTIYTYRSQ